MDRRAGRRRADLGSDPLAGVAHRRKRDATGLPPQTRYNLPIEVLYTVVPFIAVAVFFYFTARDEDEIMRTSANPDHRITVTGMQWSWQFNYTSDGGAQTTGTPGKPPTLVLPEGESVQFRLVSDDVIHSFWVPAFLFKMDVIPGQPNTFEIVPTKQGTFVGKCAELCGAGPRPDALQRRGRRRPVTTSRRSAS